MPIIKIEICGMDRSELPEGLAEKARDAFVESFSANRKHVDVRVSTVASSDFAGEYEKNDKPVYVDVLMYTLPAMDERRKMIQDFSQGLAKIIPRDPSVIVMQLRTAPRDRLAFGGTLLADRKG